MSFMINQSLATTLLDNIVSEAGNDAKIIIYDGDIPESVDNALLLNFVIAEFNCNNPCGTKSGKTLSISLAASTSTAEKDGVATFFRLETSAGNAILQGKVSSSTGTGQMKLQSINVVLGDTIELENVSFSIG